MIVWPWLLIAGMVLIGLAFVDLVQHSRYHTNSLRRHYVVGGLGLAFLAAAWAWTMLAS